MIYMELNIFILYNLLKFPIVLQHFNFFLILFQILGPMTLTENSHNSRFSDHSCHNHVVSFGDIQKEFVII